MQHLSVDYICSFACLNMNIRTEDTSKVISRFRFMGQKERHLYLKPFYVFSMQLIFRNWVAKFPLYFTFLKNFVFICLLQCSAVISLKRYYHLFQAKRGRENSSGSSKWKEIRWFISKRQKGLILPLFSSFKTIGNSKILPCSGM